MNNCRLFLVGTIVLCLITIGACGVCKNTVDSFKVPNYTVKFIPNNEHYYEGNIFVSVFDENGQKLTGAKVFLYSDVGLISELELATSSMGGFYKEEEKIKVNVTKHGFVDSETEFIVTKSEHGCFVEIRLYKK